MNNVPPATDATIINPTGDIVKISPYGTSNGVVKFKIYGALLARNNWYPLTHSHFQLCYKHSSDPDNQWNSKPFPISDIRKFPIEGFWHINIRVDTNLLDYTLQFKVGVTITDNAHHNVDRNFPINTLVYSNSSSVSIPSSMKPPSFEINHLVNVKHPSTGRWKYGLIKQKYDKQLIYGKYDISVLQRRSTKDQEVLTVLNTKNDKKIKLISVPLYIDLTSVDEMEYMFLIGERNGAEESYIRELYILLSSIFYNDYALEHEQQISTTYVGVDYISMGKFVSVNVIDFLWNRVDKGYKIKCLIGNDKEDIDIHFNEYLTLYQQREYTVRRALESVDKRCQGTFWYCDLCLCRQGDYYWMFRCQKNRKVYVGHDFCMNCVYDTIQRYNQLNGLLIELLQNYLTNDCIQSVLVYTAGDVVKL